MNINDIAKKQYEWVERMGWHNKTVLEALALIASEVGVNALVMQWSTSCTTN